MARTRGNAKSTAYQVSKIPRVEITLGQLVKILDLKVPVEKTAFLGYETANGVTSQLTAITYQPRIINTVYADPDKILGNTSLITGTNTNVRLAKGRYHISITYSGGHRNTPSGLIVSRYKWYNVTKEADVEGVISPNIAGNNNGTQSTTVLGVAHGYFEVAGVYEEFQILQRSSAAGHPYSDVCNFSENECYGKLVIRKIEEKTVRELIEEQGL